jgi:hypothetical protein
MGFGIEKILTMYREGLLSGPKYRKIFRYSFIVCVVVLFIVLIGNSGIKERILQSSVTGKVRFVDKAADGFVKDLITRVVLLSVVAAILFIASIKRIKSGNLVLALSVILFVDMFLVKGSIIHPEKTWGYEGYRIVKSGEEREKYKEPDEMIKFLKKDKSFYRIFPAPAVGLGRWSYNARPFSENKYMISGLFSTGGYHAAKLQIYQDLMNKMFGFFNSGRVPIQILNMLNVKYILSQVPLFKESSVFPLVWKQDSECIYENAKVLPRVFFVDKVRIMKLEDMLNFIVSPEFNPAEHVLFENPPSANIESASGSRAKIDNYGVNSIEINAHVENSCIMVMSEIYYPEWKAEVDGEEKEILRADYCLRALPLSPGDHSIKLKYNSHIIKFSLLISIIAFALSLILTIVGFLGFKRKVG